MNKIGIESIVKRLPDEEMLFDVADLFKVLGDSTRTKILAVLEQEALCVTDICSCVEMTKSAVSHQLRILRDSKLVKSKKIGKAVMYSFDDDHISEIFRCALDHVLEKH